MAVFIAQVGRFVILKSTTNKKRPFIIHSLDKHEQVLRRTGCKDKAWVESHTHVKSYKRAMSIIRDIQNKTIPRTKDIDYIISHIRIAPDEKYVNTLKEYIATKGDRGKQKYTIRR